MTAPAGLDRHLVVRAFQAMGDHLQAAGCRGEILLAGGAAMALAYDADRVTRDVDGLIIEGHGPVMAAAQAAASELGLIRGWLNEGVSVYLSSEPDPGRSPVFDHPNLAVYCVSAEHLFALKARAARAQDLSDLERLAGVLGVITDKQALSIVERFFPEDPISARALAIIEDLFGSPT